MSIAPVPSSRLSFGYLSLFGLGGLASYYATQAVQTMAIPVYQMSLGVDPLLLGVILFVPRFVDAFTDPIMGNISDNHQSRFGRRRPFIVAGAVAMGLTFGLIWMVPEKSGQTLQLGWLLVTSLIFFLSVTAFTVPLQSLGYEMTPDYHERTRIMAFGSFWNRIGEFTYQWVFPLTQAAFFATPMTGVRVVGWGVALLFLAIPGIVPGFIGRERFAKVGRKQEKVRLLDSIRAAFHSRPFVLLLLIVLATYGAGILASSMDYYLLVYYVCHGDLKEGAHWKGLLSSAYALVGFLSIPLLTAVSRRVGKESTLILNLGLLVVGASARWWIFRPGAGWWIMLDPFLGGGTLWVAMGMVVQSMFADICDDDELAHGQRREGMFGGVFSWLVKVGVSLPLLLSLGIVKWVGFQHDLGANQTPATFLGMRFFLSVCPAVAAIVCIILLRKYPLTQARAGETRRLLEARRGVL